MAVSARVLAIHDLVVKIRCTVANTALSPRALLVPTRSLARLSSHYMQKRWNHDRWNTFSPVALRARLNLIFACHRSSYWLVVCAGCRTVPRDLHVDSPQRHNWLELPEQQWNRFSSRHCNRGLFCSSWPRTSDASFIAWTNLRHHLTNLRSYYGLTANISS